MGDKVDERKDSRRPPSWLERRAESVKRWWHGLSRAWSLEARSRRKAAAGFFRFYGARAAEAGETLREVARGLDRRHRARLAVAGAVVALVAGLALAVEAPLKLGDWQAAFRTGGRGAGPEAGGEAGPVAGEGGPVAGSGREDPAAGGPGSGALPTGTAGAGGAAAEVSAGPGKAGGAPQQEHLVRPVAQMTWPLEGEVTRYYGWNRHPAYGDWRFSAELRLRPLPREETVRAVLPGVVQSVTAGEWGSTVVISHGDGWESRYANLASVAVSVGQRVDEGQPIGRVDAPAEAAAPVAAVAGQGTAWDEAPGGLAFALRHDGQPVDPMRYLIEE